MNYAIWDIDNCLADDEWRIPFIDWRTPDLNARYRPYHERARHDNPANVARFKAETFLGELQAVFFTARSEEFRLETHNWLRRHLGVAVPIVLMREVSSFVPSVPLKREMLFKFRAQLNPGRKIVKAFDDREDICAMYEAEGIKATVLKIHDTCPYTNPKTQEKTNA